MPDNRGDRGTEGPRDRGSEYCRCSLDSDAQESCLDGYKKQDGCLYEYGMSMVWYETLVKYECIFFPHFRNEVFFKRMV